MATQKNKITTDGVKQIDLEKQEESAFQSASKREQHINHTVKRKLSYFRHLDQNCFLVFTSNSYTALYFRSIDRWASIF